MGTKSDPGTFDCYANAKPDEPMFVLLGRDPCAGLAVTFWAKLRQLQDPDDPKIPNALACAQDLETHARSLGKSAQVDAALNGLRALIGAT